jgi:hypothetical protein
LYPKTSAGNTRPIAASDRFVAQTRQYKPNYVISADLGILNYTKTPKPTETTFTVTPKQMSPCKLPMKWLCKMANSVVGANGELLEYRRLIANQTTRATWQHSYANKIERLAQGMPGQNTGTNTIVFIKKNQVSYHITEQRM